MKGLVRSSTVQRLKRTVSILTLRLRDLEDAMGTAQEQIRTLTVKSQTATLVHGDDLETAEELVCL